MPKGPHHFVLVVLDLPKTILRFAAASLTHSRAFLAVLFLVDFVAFIAINLRGFAHTPVGLPPRRER